MQKGKFLILSNEIEQKFHENEVEKFIKNKFKFAEILNENEQFSFNKNFYGNPLIFVLHKKNIFYIFLS